MHGIQGENIREYRAKKLSSSTEARLEVGGVELLHAWCAELSLVVQKGRGIKTKYKK